MMNRRLKSLFPPVGVLLSVGAVACGQDLDPPSVVGLDDASKAAWRPMEPAPLGPRFGATSVWTGSELIVLCGFDAQDVPSCTSARYNPGSNRWSAMTVPQGLSSLTADAGFGVVSAVWTGDRVFAAGPDYAGLYDPVTDVWAAVDPGPTRGRVGPGLAWTGSAVFAFAEGSALFDPRTGLWTSTSTVMQPSPRSSPIVVWTGSEALVWGGYADNDRPPELRSGGRYDPRTNTWAAIESTGGAAAVVWNGAHVWTGSELLLWGAFDNLGVTRPGAAYDPVLDTWRPITDSGSPPGRGTIGYAWTKEVLLVWGGADPLDFFRRTAAGALYNPALDQWSALPATPQAPSPRSGFAYAWTGTEFIVWGGTAGAQSIFDDGAILSF